MGVVMSFSLSGTTITQVGTDTSLSGLSGIAGVTVTNIGEATIYNIGSRDLVINGTLSFATQKRASSTSQNGEQLLIPANGKVGGVLQINGSLTLGSFDTNSANYTNNGGVAAIYQGVDNGTSSAGGFAGTGPSLISLNASGTLKCFGRAIYTSGGLAAFAGSTLEIRDSYFAAYRTYWYTDYILTDTVLQTEFFIVSVATEFSGIINKNIASYVALSGSTPDGTYTVKDIPKLPDGDSLIQFGSPSIDVILNIQNSTEGSDYAYASLDSIRHYTLNFKRILNVAINDTAGIAIEDAKFQSRGKAGVVTTELTDSSGETGEFEVDIAQNITDNGVATIEYYSKNNNDTDVFDYRTISYNHMLFSPPTENLKGIGTKQFSVALLDDLSITQSTKATVDAYTELETSAKFYDRAKSFLYDNYDGETATIVTRSGDTIDAGSYDVVVDATASPAFAFDGSTITIHADTFTGNITTTSTVTLSNGAIIDGIVTDTNGTTGKLELL
jgi:hypothetical protein